MENNFETRLKELIKAYENDIEILKMAMPNTTDKDICQTKLNMVRYFTNDLQRLHKLYIEVNSDK